MQKTIYLDYQASTPVDPRVVARMLPLLQEGYGNPHSADHIVGWLASDIVEQARQKVAKAIGADADEILFTSGATESNNLAIFGVVRKNISAGRKRILVSATEHKCVLEAAYTVARQVGVAVDVIPVNGAGVVDVDFIESEIRKKDDVLMVSVMSVNNEVGTIQPVGTIGQLTRERGVLFHTDAAQAMAAIDLDVFADNVDLLSLSSHKLYGPQGIGALFVRRELHDKIEPIIYGGGQQLGLRSGTIPVFLAAGFAEAIEVMQCEIAVGEREVLAKKRNRLVEGIMRGCYEVGLNGPALCDRHPGNANLFFAGYQNHDIIAGLQPLVAASTGAACTSGTPEPSYILRAMGFSHDYASSCARLSLGRFTTDEEVDTAITMILNVLERLS